MVRTVSPKVSLLIRKALGKVAIVTGLLVTFGFAFLLKRSAWPEQIGLALLYLVLQILLYAFYRRVTSRTQCPRCSNPRAKLNYDENRDEYLTCEACGLHQATGMSQPND